MFRHNTPSELYLFDQRALRLVRLRVQRALDKSARMAARLAVLRRDIADALDPLLASPSDAAVDALQLRAAAKRALVFLDRTARALEAENRVSGGENAGVAVDHSRGASDMAYLKHVGIVCMRTRRMFD